MDHALERAMERYGLCQKQLARVHGRISVALARKAKGYKPKAKRVQYVRPCGRGCSMWIVRMDGTECLVVFHERQDRIVTLLPPDCLNHEKIWGRAGGRPEARLERLFKRIDREREP